MHVLLPDPPRRQRPDQRAHHGQVLLAAWEALAHQVVGCNGQVAFFKRDIGAETVEERQLEVGGFAERAVRADLHAVAAEDAAV